MHQFISMLRKRFSESQPKKTFAVAHPKELQVIVPDAVVLPLPQAPRDEIRVPASINGRDLSTGRL